MQADQRGRHSCAVPCWVVPIMLFIRQGVTPLLDSGADQCYVSCHKEVLAGFVSCYL